MQVEDSFYGRKRNLGKDFIAHNMTACQIMPPNYPRKSEMRVNRYYRFQIKLVNKISLP